MLQDSVMQWVQNIFHIGYSRLGRTGSCALIGVVSNNTLYIGNAGDSLALLLSKNNN